MEISPENFYLNILMELSMWNSNGGTVNVEKSSGTVTVEQRGWNSKVEQ